MEASSADMSRTINDIELASLHAESQVSLLQDYQRTINTPSTRFASIDLLVPWFPDVNPKFARRNKRFFDRDVALFSIQLLSVLVLGFNLSVTIYALVKFGPRGNISDILGAESGGSCALVKVWNRWLHFGINALSTILLGASNYCAQLLLAPTREDINKAHSRSRWLDIGVQSFRNFRAVGPKRQILWVVLMLSSGLLHLFWNSAVFMANPVSRYSIGYVTADFVDDAQPWQRLASPDLEYIRNNSSTVRQLSNKDCIAEYTGRLSGLSSLLVVSSNVMMADERSFDEGNRQSSLVRNESTLLIAMDWRLNSDWMCTAWSTYGTRSKYTCTRKFLEPQAEDWTVIQHDEDPNRSVSMKVDHCLVLDNLQDMQDRCVLRISKLILGLVTVLNLIKCVCIAQTVRMHNQFRIHRDVRAEPSDGSVAAKLANSVRTILDSKSHLDPIAPCLVTVGDAIASFLEEEDSHTKQCMFATKRDVEKKEFWNTHRSYSNLAPERWYQAASRRRWIITIFLCAATIGTVGGLLRMTLSVQQAVGVDISLPSLWGYGFGAQQQWALALTGVTDHLGPTKGFFFSVLFANSFQVIISALYLLYNNLLTVMIVAAEWNDYISERKTLRMSAPRGIQRSNYFLSLPYRYSVTLMILSGLLHWFISQSVFVVQTVAYVPKGTRPLSFVREPTLDISCIGFSSIGIIIALIVGCLLVLSLLIIGFGSMYSARGVRTEFRQPPYTMPLVSTCSAAISANCHKHPEDTDCALLPLRWGFVENVSGGNGGRFTFTTAVDLAYPKVVDGKVQMPYFSQVLTRSGK